MPSLDVSREVCLTIPTDFVQYIKKYVLYKVVW